MHASTRISFPTVALVACLLITLTLSTGATAFAQGNSDVTNRARGSERVVVARISAVEAVATRNEYGDELIVSRSTIEVEQTLKGPFTPTLTIDVEGGTLGELTLEVSDMPRVRPGDRGVFFVRRAPSGRNVPHQRGNGILKLSQDDRVEDSGLTLEDVRQAVGAAGNGRGNQ